MFNSRFVLLLLCSLLMSSCTSVDYPYPLYVREHKPSANLPDLYFKAVVHLVVTTDSFIDRGDFTKGFYGYLDAFASEWYLRYGTSTVREDVYFELLINAHKMGSHHTNPAAQTFITSSIFSDK